MWSVLRLLRGGASPTMSSHRRPVLPSDSGEHPTSPRLRPASSAAAWVRIGGLGLGLLLAATAAVAAPPVAEDSGRVIVRFRDDSAWVHAGSRSLKPRVDRAQRLSQRLGQPLEAGRDIGPLEQVVRAASLDGARLASWLSRQPEVEYAVVDERRHVAAVTPNDTYFDSAQWYLQTPGPSAPTGVDLPNAWSLSKGSGQVIAVLDNGVRLTHADLAGKMLPGYDMVGADSWNGKSVYCTANDGSGRDADASDPGDGILASELGDETSIFPADRCHTGDSNWHGTKVAGIAAAVTNNGAGIAGVAWDAKVLPVRVVGKCGGWDADILAAMRWAANLAPAAGDTLPPNPNPARVINMSLSGSATCSAPYVKLISELRSAGVVVVAAAGNGAADSGPGGAVVAPANCPGVIGVGGLARDGLKAAYANLGPALTISAPSGDSNVSNRIASTTDKGALVPEADQYTVQQLSGVAGTSFSTPIVSGTIALMLAADPRLQSDDVAAILRRTARSFPSGPAGEPFCSPGTGIAGRCVCTTATCGAGMLDAGAAVKAALNGPHPRIVASTPTPVAAAAFVLDGSTSLARKDSSLVAWKWTLVDGGGIVTAADLQSPAQNRTAVTASAAGSFLVRLTVTDATGRLAALDQLITVGASAAAASTEGGAPSQPADVHTAAAVDGSTGTVVSKLQPELACLANSQTSGTDGGTGSGGTPGADGATDSAGAGSGGGGGAASEIFLALLAAATVAAARLRRATPGRFLRAP